MAGISDMTQGSQQIKFDYLNLLVTQLKNQNPLEPMDNAEMTSQLAQISQLDQLETANASFETVLGAAQGQYAAALVGKTVSFIPQGQTEAVVGTVASAERVNGEFHIRVGDRVVALDSIQTIHD